MNDRQPGRIITFYAYKSGTGRTLALANIAWILAGNGQRVLVIDWDLEAPDLHRFYRPFLEDPAGSSSPGLIDFIKDFGISPSGLSGSFLDVLPYVQSVKWHFAQAGYLDLMTAGRYDSTYPERAKTFSWQEFYEKLGGAAFLDRLRAQLREDYDYVLIDSRAGISDISGICTVKMPDSLVIGFTLNAQSIGGSVQVARSVAEQRRSDPLRIFPVPMKVELNEKSLLDRTFAQAESDFAPLLTDRSPEELRRYWQEVVFYYSPFYSFGEVLAVFGDLHRQSDSMLASAERLTRYLTDGKVTATAPVTPEERKEALEKYSGKG